jgi:tetratricopeptide (TPR) repeat protein
MLKEHDKAIKDSTSALKLNSAYVKAYIRRADSYFSLGDINKCIYIYINIYIYTYVYIYILFMYTYICIYIGGKENIEKCIKDYEKSLEYQTDEKGVESVNSKLKKVLICSFICIYVCMYVYDVLLCTHM